MSTNLKIQDRPTRCQQIRVHQKEAGSRARLTAQLIRNRIPEMDTPHPLVGLDECWLLLCKKSLDFHRAPWQAWLIRKVYDWCDWSGDFCTELFATFTDQEVARAIAAQKNVEAKEKETGDVWEVKQSPVNRVLPYESVVYGTREYPATTIDDRYRVREPTQLADCKAVQQVTRHFVQAEQALTKLERVVGR